MGNTQSNNDQEEQDATNQHPPSAHKNKQRNSERGATHNSGGAMSTQQQAIHHHHRHHHQHHQQQQQQNVGIPEAAADHFDAVIAARSSSVGSRGGERRRRHRSSSETWCCCCSTSISSSSSQCDSDGGRRHHGQQHQHHGLDGIVAQVSPTLLNFIGSATEDSRWAANVVVADPTTRESECNEDFSRVEGGITNSGRAVLPTAHDPEDGAEDEHRGVHHDNIKPPEVKGVPPPFDAKNNERNRSPPPPLLPLPSVASWREEPATMNVEANAMSPVASTSAVIRQSNHSSSSSHNAIPLEEESSLLRDSAVVLLPVASSDSISALHNDNDHQKQEKSSDVVLAAPPPVESSRSKRRARAANSTLSSVAIPSVSFFNTVVVLHSHSSGSSSSSSTDKGSSCEETDDDENHSDPSISATPSQHHSTVIPAPKTSQPESGFTIAIMQPTEEYHESGRGGVVSRRRSSLGDDDDGEFRHSHPIPTGTFLTAAFGGGGRGGGNSPNLHYNHHHMMSIPSPHDAAIEEDRIGLGDECESDEEDDDDDKGSGVDGRMTPPGLMYVVSIPPPMRSSLSVLPYSQGDGGGAVEDAFGSPTGYCGGAADMSPPATSSSEHSDDKPLRGSAQRRGGWGRGSASRGRHQGGGNSNSGSRSAAPRSPFSSVISRMPPSFTQQQDQGQLQGQLNDWARSSHSGALLSPPEATSLSNLAGPPPLNLPMLLDGSEPAPSMHMPVVPTLPVFIGSTTSTTNGPPVPPRQRRRQQVAALGSSGFTTKSTTATTSSSSTKGSDEYLELEISSQRLLHANHPRSSSSGGAAVSEGSMSLSIRSTAYVELEPLTAGSVSPRDQLAVLRQRSYQRSVPGFHARGGGMNSAGPSSAAPQMFVVPVTPHNPYQAVGGATWAPPSPRRRTSRRSSTSGGKNPLPLIAGDDHEFDPSPLPPSSSREGSRRSEHNDQ